MPVEELHIGKFSVISSHCKKRNIQINQFKIKKKKSHKTDKRE